MLKNHGRHNRIIRACIEILFCNELLLENNSSNMLQLSTLEGSFPPERCQPLSDLPNHCSLQMSSTGCHPSKLYFHELIEETGRASGLSYSKLHRVGNPGRVATEGCFPFFPLCRQLHWPGGSCVGWVSFVQCPSPCQVSRQHCWETCTLSGLHAGPVHTPTK